MSAATWPMADRARVLSHMPLPDGDDCMVWRLRSRTKGYGCIWIQGRCWQAHRAVYELLVGPVDDDLVIDHRCHSIDSTCIGGPSCIHRACVNPSHLEVVTQAENVRRSRPAQKVYCANGHEFTPENTYIRPNAGEGQRDCRTCIRERARRYQQRRRQAA